MNDLSFRSELDRRTFFKKMSLLVAGGSLAGGVGKAFAQDSVTLPFANGTRDLLAFPGKRPLIRLTTRPPQLETPFAIFNEGVITPNDAFFVRYHLSAIPTEVDPVSFRLQVQGAVTQPLKLSLAELKKLGTPVDLIAVNQCSGNSRGFFSPRVNGGQLGNGAMGCARWTGLPLRTLLDKAGLEPGARQVTFDGLDHGALEATPDFVKALDVDHAREGEVMVAWAMNGADLPMLNGYPLRLVVPGYFGTYWVKHLSQIVVRKEIFEGFWMKSAYRVPDTPDHSIEPGTAPKSTLPIGKFAVRSFITNLSDGAAVRANREQEVRGIAFDAGQGISSVAFSSDGGHSWRDARLSRDHGRFSFREWKISFKPAKGESTLLARATNRGGETQPLVAGWNPGGYLRNVVEAVKIQAA